MTTTQSTPSNNAHTGAVSTNGVQQHRLDVPAEVRESTSTRALRYVAAATRISLGWVFLWAFLDKPSPLDSHTGRDSETGIVDRFGDAAWIHGGAADRRIPGLAHQGSVLRHLPELRRCGLGRLAFMLGLPRNRRCTHPRNRHRPGHRRRGAAGHDVGAVLPPDNNPFMDDHLIYALTLVMLALLGAGKTFGFGKAWERLAISQRLGELPEVAATTSGPAFSRAGPECTCPADRRRSERLAVRTDRLAYARRLLFTVQPLVTLHRRACPGGAAGRREQRRSRRRPRRPGTRGGNRR